jgi:phytoene dehydrogenase-like protein
MLRLFESLGGEVETGRWVTSIHDLPPANNSVWDVSPRQLVRLAGDCLPDTYRRRIERFRYGPGVFKMDFAIDGPVPWKDEACMRAAVLHIGGTLEEIAASERSVRTHQPSSQPFILLAQPSLFDPTRAPAGMHTVWAYCHVPNRSTEDMSAAIESQIERFAPGFRKQILARHVFSPTSMEAYDPNYVGGDINAGLQDITQFYTRPVVSLDQYHVPGTHIFLCSSSTPPGGGVHGMCGYWAARSVLRAERS